MKSGNRESLGDTAVRLRFINWAVPSADFSPFGSEPSHFL
jgi:hypothetical protein